MELAKNAFEVLKPHLTELIQKGIAVGGPAATALWAAIKDKLTQSAIESITKFSISKSELDEHVAIGDVARALEQNPDLQRLAAESVRQVMETEGRGEDLAQSATANRVDQSITAKAGIHRATQVANVGGGSEKKKGMKGR